MLAILDLPSKHSSTAVASAPPIEWASCTHHPRTPDVAYARNGRLASFHAPNVVSRQQGESESSLDRSIHCATCATRLTHAKCAIVVNAAHEHSVINPQGCLYRIRCFNSVENVSPAGEPSQEFTWFPGYAWTVLLCRQCSQHVGWQFDAANARFFVLIVAQIVD